MPMPISWVNQCQRVYQTSQDMDSPRPMLTSADDLALDIPLSQHGKEKGHGVDDGDCQAKL